MVVCMILWPNFAVDFSGMVYIFLTINLLELKRQLDRKWEIRKTLKNFPLLLNQKSSYDKAGATGGIAST